MSESKTKRVLTGITSSGKPHIGNILGAILPAIELSKDDSAESLFFISDLHSMTTIKDGKARVEYRNAIAATWLAFGFDYESNLFYRQSKVPQVTELTWYLNCFTPFPMLNNAHAFKSKADNLSDVNAGLFTYPVLMAADILLYDAHVVPVGKDQKQHLEMTRDIAKSFNHQYGEVFVVPEASISENVMQVPGTDGRKMSKSYNNYIDMMASKKQLRKQVMGIVTDAKTLEEPKDPDNCLVYDLYKLLATEEETKAMHDNLLAGGYGYGHAKNELLDKILTGFAKERELFNHYMDNIDLLEKALNIGEEKARDIANAKLKKVRSLLGY
ncbi:MAG: tryptophan--tRNA ligase [Bacteroidota bacterium]